MPRIPSVRLRLARVMNAHLARIEDEMAKDPAKKLSEAEARTLANIARADALVQGRNPVEGEDEEPSGKQADPKKADELVQRIRSGMQDSTARRVEGDDDDSEP